MVGLDKKGETILSEVYMLGRGTSSASEKYRFSGDIPVKCKAPAQGHMSAHPGGPPLRPLGSTHHLCPGASSFLLLQEAQGGRREAPASGRSSHSCLPPVPLTDGP